MSVFDEFRGRVRRFRQVPRIVSAGGRVLSVSSLFLCFTASTCPVVTSFTRATVAICGCLQGSHPVDVCAHSVCFVTTSAQPFQLHQAASPHTTPIQPPRLGDFRVGAISSGVRRVHEYLIPWLIREEGYISNISCLIFGTYLQIVCAVPYTLAEASQ